jgi:hypothetical protein
VVEIGDHPREKGDKPRGWMDGGRVQGREAIRAQWTRQWAAIAIEVHQVVRDLGGKLLLDETVRHVLHIDQGLVTRFDIENAGGLAAIRHD